MINNHSFFDIRLWCHGSFENSFGNVNSNTLCSSKGNIGTLTCCAVSGGRSLAPSAWPSAWRAGWSAARTRALASRARWAGVHGRWARPLWRATPPRAAVATTLPPSPKRWPGPVARHSGPWGRRSGRRWWSSPPERQQNPLKPVKLLNPLKLVQQECGFRLVQKEGVGGTCSLAVSLCRVEFCSCREVVCRCSAAIWPFRDVFWLSSCLSCSFNRPVSVCKEAFWRRNQTHNPETRLLTYEQYKDASVLMYHRYYVLLYGDEVVFDPQQLRCGTAIV